MPEPMDIHVRFGSVSPATKTNQVSPLIRIRPAINPPVDVGRALTLSALSTTENSFVMRFLTVLDDREDQPWG